MIPVSWTWTRSFTGRGSGTRSTDRQAGGIPLRLRQHLKDHRVLAPLPPRLARRPRETCRSRSPREPPTSLWRGPRQQAQRSGTSALRVPCLRALPNLRRQLLLHHLLQHPLPPRQRLRRKLPAQRARFTLILRIAAAAVAAITMCGIAALCRLCAHQWKGFVSSPGKTQDHELHPPRNNLGVSPASAMRASVATQTPSPLPKDGWGQGLKRL